MGECTGSICLAYGLESCQCVVGPEDPAARACELCCKQPGEDKPCQSSFDWNDPPFDVPDMYAKPGTPCNDYNGYCDVSQKCREVDPSGPLATLRKLLLSEESIASFKKWVISNWYAVALIVVVILALLVSTVECGFPTAIQFISFCLSSVLRRFAILYGIGKTFRWILRVIVSFEGYPRVSEGFPVNLPSLVLFSLDFHCCNLELRHCQCTHSLTVVISSFANRF